jgi:diacylglycerol kinase (ATP)
MNNKPKYSLFKNAKYAIDGLVHAIKTETSFKLELLLSPFVMVAIYMFPLEFYSQMILFVTLIMVMVVELLNSAVENVVDLVTKEFNPLAKAAKDIGATAVLFTLLLHLGCWIAVLVHTF